MCQGGFLN